MIIQSKRVWLDEHFTAAQVVMEDGMIQDILPYNTEKADYDYGDHYVFPGFMDIHTHGHNGVESINGDPKEMERWQKEITAEGVTSFLAATATQTVDANLTSFQKLSKCVGKGAGAELLGIYNEGNFISMKHRGAHDPRLIMKPDVELMKRYIDAADGAMKLMILAVEEDENLSVLDYAISRGLKVCVGHSGATYAQVKEAMRHGATSITHTYNGMAPYHHREAGIVGAALDIDNLYTEIIADGHHVCWEAIRILGRMKDRYHLILVSDASPLKGYDGELPDDTIRDEEGNFRTLQGNLASSSLRICDGIKNLITYADVPFVNAVNAATINPARMVGVDDRKGSIEIKKDADIVVVTANFEVIQTFCRGQAMLGV